MATDNDKVELVRGMLRAIRFPGFKRDIVAAGFVQEIEVDKRRVTVHFAPNTRNQAKVEQMERGIRDALGGAECFEHVEIQRHQPFADAGVLSDGGPTPRQAYMDEKSNMPEPGNVERTLQRPDIALQAGYDGSGPEPLGGPRGEIYEGELPVFQWEIDPHDPNAKSGTANLTMSGWEFRVWWQVHPARLVYASIQAMREDWVEHAGEARSHPVGRSDAVNLVYDLDRKAVVAIYGTVQDFRPFVDAFCRGYVQKNLAT
ncbi:MAG: iron-sulfur cluster assembly protein [Hyphomicrobiales bacterium]|nr:iron-sulfur cluster assembly protein [Hyphomicrobiales bacterium]